MSQENVEIVKRGFEYYFATGEVLWELLDENVEVHDYDTPDQGDYRGHAGYARWLEDWGAAWAEWSLDVEEYIDAGDSVIVFCSCERRDETAASRPRDTMPRSTGSTKGSSWRPTTTTTGGRP